jgi:hypothetical protein
MLDIAVQYADWLHTGNWKQAQALAYGVQGRHAPLVRTEVVWMALPDLAPPPAHMKQSLYKTADEIASRLESLAHDGCQHAIVDLRPFTAEALRRLATGVRLYRERT